MLNQWIHQLPGRLRVTVPGLKGNKSLAERFNLLLPGMAGVTKAKANALTGKLLIFFDSNYIDSSTIIINIDNILKGSDIIQTDHSNYPAKFGSYHERIELPLSRQLFHVMFSGFVLGVLYLKHRVIGRSSWAESRGLFGLATFTTILTGYPMFYSGVKNLTIRKKINYDLVISAVTLALLILRESFTGLLVTWVVNFSGLIHSLNIYKANETVREIIGAAPKEAWVLLDGVEVYVPITKVNKGDTVVVNSGQYIPVDGVVISGCAAVEEGTVKGLSYPSYKKEGSEVLTGTRIIHGRILIRAERIGADTYLYQMIRGIENQFDQKQDLDIVNEQGSERLIILSLLLAAANYLFTRNISRSVAMMIAACPSAAGLASPTALGTGVGRASKGGIYVRDARHLLTAGGIDTVVFDKTGTLTTNDMDIEQVIILNKEYSEENLISLAALAEGVARHPVAQAVREKAVEMHMRPMSATDESKVFPGLGVWARVNNKVIFVGNERLMIENNIKIEIARVKITRLHHLSLNPLLVAVDGKLCGILAVRENYKPESRQAIQQLRAMGIKRTVLLTGDTKGSAHIAAERLGIDEGYGELDPIQKAEFIKKLKAEGCKVAMVGDGVNDIAALNESQAGFAIGCSGAWSAACAGGIVIPAQNPVKVAEAIFIGQHTREVIKQNYNFATGLNVIGLGLAAAGLITPLSAGLFTNIANLVVIFNSSTHVGGAGKGWYSGIQQIDRRYKKKKQTMVEGEPRTRRGSLQNWHTMGVQEVLQSLNSDACIGLTHDVRELRIQEYGGNSLIIEKKVSWVSLILEPFKDFMIQLLLGASAVSLIVGEYGDALTILFIVGVEAVLGAIQGLRAEKSLSALRKLAAPSARVIIDGEVIELNAAELVPGDVIYLTEGDSVPSDCRLIESTNLEVEEASLTGESVPVLKHADVSCEAVTLLGDQINMVFMGTLVTKGHSRAVVVATGLNTEMGRVACMLQDAEKEETPLQQQLEVLGKQLAFGCLIVCGGVIGAGLLRGRPLMEMLKTGVSLAVGAIPEGLPAVVTISLAFGVQRMVKGNAIVRRLPSVETLGKASVICTDKTGTLTKNEMTVTEIFGDGKTWEVTGKGYLPEGEFMFRHTPVNPMEDKTLFRILTAASLCNNADLKYSKGQEPVISGDPTEIAMITAAIKGGLPWPGLKEAYCRKREVSFDAVRKMMTILCHDSEGQVSVYTKGAPDHVLKRCTQIYKNNRIVPLDLKGINDILSANEQMASKALRVLAVAYKPMNEDDDKVSDENLEEDLIFVGLLGMEDPPRNGVKEAVEKCSHAGVKVVMVTGDHPITASAIARQLNILSDGLVLTGQQIDNMTDEELVAVTDRLQVCSRTTPEHKLRIVKAFKRRGHIVAMTGDGVNDAPAVKEADIGIAMGRKGTDVTRESADIILADDNFATIVSAVEEGRTVGDNIRKALRYVLAGNMGEVLAIFVAAVSGMPMPLVPSQILWVNLVTESIPAMALGADPPEKGIMTRRPMGEDKIISGGLGNKIISHGVLTGVTTFGVYASTLALGGTLGKARTMAFANLVLSQLFNLFDCRKGAAGNDEGANKLLVPSAGISTALLLTVIYVPYLRPLFSTEALALRDWATLSLSTGLVGRVDRLFETNSSGGEHLPGGNLAKKLPVPSLDIEAQRLLTTGT